MGSPDEVADGMPVCTGLTLLEAVVILSFNPLVPPLPDDKKGANEEWYSRRSRQCHHSEAKNRITGRSRCRTVRIRVKNPHFSDFLLLKNDRIPLLYQKSAARPPFRHFEFGTHCGAEKQANRGVEQHGQEECRKRRFLGRYYCWVSAH